MPTIRCFPGDVLSLHVADRDCDGTIRPSLTKPVWTLSSHVLAELFEQSPDGHTVKVKAFAVGSPDVTGLTAAGPTVFTLDIIAPPVVSQVPVGDYDRNPPLRTLLDCSIVDGGGGGGGG